MELFVEARCDFGDIESPIHGIKRNWFDGMRENDGVNLSAPIFEKCPIQSVFTHQLKAFDLKHSPNNAWRDWSLDGHTLSDGVLEMKRGMRIKDAISRWTEG